MARISPVLLEPSSGTRACASIGVFLTLPYEEDQCSSTGICDVKGVCDVYKANPHPAGLSGPTARLLGQEPSV